MRWPIPFLLCVLAAAPTIAVSSARQEAANRVPQIRSTGSFPGDFDFLVGEWDVVNSRRKAWLAGNDEWVEFPSTCRVWKILNGMVVLDECVTTREGLTHRGSGYRIFNSATGRWTIYWAGTAYSELGLLRQVEGTLGPAGGELYGEEEFEGRTVRLRFAWTRVSQDEARWEQAYFDTERQAWETNWTMRFTRRSGQR